MFKLNHITTSDTPKSYFVPNIQPISRQMSKNVSNGEDLPGQKGLCDEAAMRLIMM